MDSQDANKASAKVDQATGDVKETVGAATNNDRLQAEGKAERGQGQVDEMTANVGSFVKGIKDKTEGAWKGLVNSITGK